MLQVIKTTNKRNLQSEFSSFIRARGGYPPFFYRYGCHRSRMYVLYILGCEFAACKLMSQHWQGCQFRSGTDAAGSKRKRVFCSTKNSQSKMYMDVHFWRAARAEADILFSVCFQVCGSFGAGAEKPASDDAVTGKRLEPETGFCAVWTSSATIVKTVQKAAKILT